MAVRAGAAVTASAAPVVALTATRACSTGCAPAWAGPKAGWLGRVPGLASAWAGHEDGCLGSPPSLGPSLAGSEAGLYGLLVFLFGIKK